MLYKDNMKTTFNQRSTTVNYSDKEMTFKPSHVINEQDERNLESRAKVSLLASQQRILISPLVSSDDLYAFKPRGTIARKA
jgi:hypothetical protein